ncbi:acyltransferase family protein [Mycobacterium haemophilum]|uniref:Acyltransferase n=1 Tax=Mycobacterium haemophilum TaxID=29311 RepID=A0A0I9XUF9_9MYCO|nr:acyltransferase [Mycobacterium haemophilum]AKN16493.1 acyltransferase [Mycobacterium haemophilum DSM 44634]KLO30667.1 acyltransferase [Mycobacterium haemophilum]KLO37711.1 acyltransferase [Mycobacterium haemophilum]KLO43210.1 acyltransferase [Mycobacterium haemophilum]KLO55533.1 acyltransferase [Mycobacterium haemophilum]
MTLSEERDAHGGLEQVSQVDRVASLTGIRAVAALLVVGTHAAYTTGKYTHGYWGLVGARLEIGVPIFFVLSGFLLFRPWVASVATGSPPPSVSRYAWHRVRRIMPAYVITVLFAYALYHFRTAGPNPGHSWMGLIRNLTLTQIYTDGYLGSYLHQGLTQMWSLAVEAAFYVALPLLAYLLLVLLCQRRWQPKLVLAALAGTLLISPGWLILVHTDHWFPDGARLWLPTYLAWFLGGMMLAVLQAMGVRCYAFGAIPLAIICYFIVSTPIAGAPTTSPASLGQALVKTGFYAAIATLAVAPLALGDLGWYSRLLASRPMVWLGEISYEIFLIHLVTMEFAMVYVVQDHVYTGSMLNLAVATLALTVPLAWLLHRCTRVRNGTEPSAR